MGTQVHFRNPHFLYFPSHHSCTISSIILYTEAFRVPTTGLGPAGGSHHQLFILKASFQEWLDSLLAKSLGSASGQLGFPPQLHPLPAV